MKRDFAAEVREQLGQPWSFGSDEADEKIRGLLAALEQAEREKEELLAKLTDARTGERTAYEAFIGERNAREQAGRALEQEREKMRIKDEALDFIAVVNDALPARKYAERTIELMRRRAREALASSPGAAAEAPGACSECGVPPGEPHREACFFLTGDPADLLEKRAGG